MCNVQGGERGRGGGAVHQHPSIRVGGVLIQLDNTFIQAAFSNRERLSKWTFQIDFRVVLYRQTIVHKRAPKRAFHLERSCDTFRQPQRFRAAKQDEQQVSSWLVSIYFSRSPYWWTSWILHLLLIDSFDTLSKWWKYCGGWVLTSIRFNTFSEYFSKYFSDCRILLRNTFVDSFPVASKSFAPPV